MIKYHKATYFRIITCNTTGPDIMKNRLIGDRVVPIVNVTGWKFGF